MASTQNNADLIPLNRGPLVLGLSWTFTSLALAIVIVRLWVRTKKPGYWSWDDHLMLIATIFQAAGQGLFTVAYHFGLGQHDSLLEVTGQVPELHKWVIIGRGPGQITSVLARISITITLIRLFGIHKWLKWFLVVATSAQTCFGIITLFFDYMRVTPFECLWMYTRTDCHEAIKISVWFQFFYLTNALHAFSDVSYVLLPVAVIWRLKLALRRKIGLIMLMSMSLFTVAMSILKIYTFASMGGASNEFFYRGSLHVLFLSLEQSCVIIMGCIPTLGHLAKMKLPFDFSNMRRSLGSLMSPAKYSSKDSSAIVHNRSFSSTRNHYTATLPCGEMELDTRGLRDSSSIDTTAHVPALTSNYGDGIRIPLGAAGILRTDQFSVEFEQDQAMR